MVRPANIWRTIHSFRDIYATGYAAGAIYYDFYLPVLEFNQPVDRDPSYWRDGRTRRFSNDAFGLWKRANAS